MTANQSANSGEGLLTFKRVSDKGHFLYNFKISDFHAAKILEYIGQIPHKAERFRDSRGRFTTPEKIVGQK